MPQTTTPIDTAGQNLPIQTADTVQTHTVATTTLQPAPAAPCQCQPPTTPQPNYLGWGALALAAAATIMALRMRQTINQLINGLRQAQDRIDRHNHHRDQTTQATTQDLRQQLQQLRQDLDRQQLLLNDLQNRQEPTPAAPQPQPTPAAPVSQTLYGNLQIETGAAPRFATRSLTDRASTDKMFILETDPTAGTGTYTVNPQAQTTLLSDIDLLRNAAKEFTLPGHTATAQIQVQQKGKITLQGKYWTVAEPMEITVK